MTKIGHWNHLLDQNHLAVHLNPGTDSQFITSLITVSLSKAVTPIVSQNLLLAIPKYIRKTQPGQHVSGSQPFFLAPPPTKTKAHDFFPFTALNYLYNSTNCNCILFHKKHWSGKVTSTLNWYLKYIISHCVNQPITPKLATDPWSENHLSIQMTSSERRQKNYTYKTAPWWRNRRTVHAAATNR